LQNNGFVVAALLIFCIVVLPSSISEGARICRSRSLISGPIGRILNIPHTWVRHSFSCRDSGSACTSNRPFTEWNNIGFEIQTGSRLYGQGRLRDDSGETCVAWIRGNVGGVAAAATAQQERSAISALASFGWNDARYGIHSGMRIQINDAGCNVRSSSFRPNVCSRLVPGPLQPLVCPNVCWTFTCAFSSYLFQVLGVRPRATGLPEISISSASDIPSNWTCAPEQYGSGDGCQCSCGAFDPDCDDMSAVPTDCPNYDDVCVLAALEAPMCMLRHEVLSERKAIQIASGVPVHHPQFFFTNDTDSDDGPWGNYSSAFTRSNVPSTWNCNVLFYGSKDGCDCKCGAWDPDCDENAGRTQQVFNCDTSNPLVRCAMSRTSPSEPVCLYDSMASSAAIDAGFPPLSDSASPPASVSTASIVAASVGSTLGFVILVASITYFIRRRKSTPKAERSVKATLLRSSNTEPDVASNGI